MNNSDTLDKLRSLKLYGMFHAFKTNLEKGTTEGYMGVILKVATSFYPKWPHITLQSGQLISVKSGQLAYFKMF
ncbi:MAG: hypothetical protein EOO91_02345 [Pedobacter sp.]|nr:MAG: hypothetical protein EOO91_02345 [Pedobacter sp.]